MEVEITTSTTNNMTGLNGNGSGTSLGTFNLTQGTGAPIPGQLFNNAFTAQYVRFDINSNHSGLPEDS